MEGTRRHRRTRSCRPPHLRRDGDRRARRRPGDRARFAVARTHWKRSAAPPPPRLGACAIDCGN